ncbi:XdhC family protein [Ferroacidibacillus organovorans]|uniref:Xanthine dehydrogenase n=1 Tax=Ferroacidibacillus organovorans TaxID=1765683 RepID=A0A162SZ88_9BACL|nr:XdhC/CoxI family protein [Ferroacidibacillus organovorans]KYP80297.1 xanthine dehydrogenase [Ferroacidibacillus organovorans]OAG93375.1 xanthine dehydrogenase [Ferroacidibacillus organovorans]OPG15897.1 xanthine dehydrogenase [Ferroacidibacillus organovorans]
MSRLLEARAIAARIKEVFARGQSACLLSITSVVGSAYRQPGAKMMIAEDESMYGTLSGGCLEGDLLNYALEAMSDGRPRLCKYDLRENELWSLGIGCKGMVEIMVWPVRKDDPFYQSLFDAFDGDYPVTMVMELPIGSRAILSGGNLIYAEGPLVPEVIECGRLREKTRTRAECVTAEQKTYYVDTMRKPEHLVICGAGHDAIPLCGMAQQAGFAVTILDPRRAFNQAERFPDANHQVTEADTVDPATLNDAFWVVMNHHQARDEASIALAVRANPRYIGVLGPLSRTREMLETQQLSLTDGPFHAPVGLDLGSETVEEVAVSILSELMAVRSGRNAAPLHAREKVHD